MPRILPGKWGKERRGGQRKPAKLEQAKLKASPPFRIPARNASSPQMCRPSTALGCVQLGSTSIPSRNRGGRGFVHRSSARIDSGEGRKSVEKEVERDSEPTLPLHSSRSWEKTSDGMENIGSEYQFRERLMKLPGWPDLLRR